MRRRLGFLAIAIAATATLGLATPSPVSAAQGAPVRAGYDECGNFQIWVNGTPTIHYLICNPPA